MSMVYINERIDVNTTFKKITSNLWVVCIGSNSFKGISYAGKPLYLNLYPFKSMEATKEEYLHVFVFIA